MHEDLTSRAKKIILELIDAAKLRRGQLLVIGCSSSEIAGVRIGKGGSLELAQAVLGGIYPELQARGIQLAVQCCEHLNRALIVERAVAEQRQQREIIGRGEERHPLLAGLRHQQKNRSATFHT